MEAQSEKQKEAAAGIPLRIYPALDGSEADVVDRVPFHWHTESEIVIVDAGTVSLVIADRAYQGTRGDIFFIGSEELHEIRATGQGTSFTRSCFRWNCWSLPAPTMQKPACWNRWPRDICASPGKYGKGRRGKRRCTGCWPVSFVPAFGKAWVGG